MLSVTQEHAVRALVHLAAAGPQACVSAKDIAATLGIPRSYLGNIMSVLARAGIVRSQRGPRGGFWLSRSPDCITIGEVVAPLASLGTTPQAELPSLPASLGNRKWESLGHQYKLLLEHATLADFGNRP